jgi:hypothetical protein
MAQNIFSPIVTKQFEITVIRSQPAIKNLHHLNRALSQPETAGYLLSPIASVTFNVDIQMQLSMLTQD